MTPTLSKKNVSRLTTATHLTARTRTFVARWPQSHGTRAVCRPLLVRGGPLAASARTALRSGASPSRGGGATHVEGQQASDSLDEGGDKRFVDCNRHENVRCDGGGVAQTLPARAQPHTWPIPASHSAVIIVPCAAVVSNQPTGTRKR